ncbi:MAG: sigma-70 family RNA polymerase sigma factor [Flavobacteriaceae bacterium]|nr:sigma-70 family RNA polymerase sigma factor [Flavobacteriaceae bacterium]
MSQEEFYVLLEQLKNGNNEYLKIIFEEHGAYCISNIQRKFRCPLEDAEDLLVDAILNFRDKILQNKLTHITSIRNYIYTTCVNMKREKNYYTHRKKEKEHEVKLFLYSENDNTNEYKEELLKRSLDSFKQLGEPCQQILRYFYIYNNSMEEIAAKMNLLNANSAKVTKARCYKKWLEIIKKSKK